MFDVKIRVDDRMRAKNGVRHYICEVCSEEFFHYDFVSPVMCKVCGQWHALYRVLAKFRRECEMRKYAKLEASDA
jgi:DNA-directed RNA polymerase subunit RPC12/RpoP